MKIYFEDGRLKKDVLNGAIPYRIDLMLDATNGYSSCTNDLLKMSKDNYNAVVYTNEITALSNEYAWNEELKASEIYIRNKDGVFTRVDELTPKCLREAHNIMKLYISGHFNSEW